MRVSSQEKGSPTNWVRVSPVPITGAVIILVKNAPHPNASRLFMEWLFSPKGLLTYEKITGEGVVSPGSGTRSAKALEGLPLLYRTEEVALKTIDLGLEKRFAQLLGEIPE